MFWHGEVSVEKTAELDCRVEPEGSVKSKPGDEVSEQFREGGNAEHGGDQDQGGPSATEFRGEYLTDDDLGEINDQVSCCGEYLDDGIEAELTPSKDQHDNDQGSPADVGEVLLVLLDRLEVGDQTEAGHGEADRERGAEEQRSSW